VSKTESIGVGINFPEKRLTLPHKIKDSWSEDQLFEYLTAVQSRRGMKCPLVRQGGEVYMAEEGWTIVWYGEPEPKPLPDLLDVPGFLRLLKYQSGEEKLKSVVRAKKAAP